MSNQHPCILLLFACCAIVSGGHLDHERHEISRKTRKGTLLVVADPEGGDRNRLGKPLGSPGAIPGRVCVEF